jgi:DNA mismatch repair protein MutL
MYNFAILEYIFDKNNLLPFYWIMAKIKQLPITEAQKIAAGEVVERPANVVKELLENSLDAGATSITLYLEEGGKDLIRIIDNGCGMDPEDARMSIKHHATSKISTVHDLATLVTFGFRGEALSSIAAVSKVTLTTKETHSQTGITLYIEGGTITQEEITAGNTGTDIAIAELFYNIPARKKFLKTKETEWRATLQLFSAFCLDYPPIHFKLYHDNKLVHNFPSVSDLGTRLTQMYEKALTQHILLIEAREEKMNLHIQGAISDPRYYRYDRNHLFFFVNQRWIKNHKLAQALLRGYQNVLQPDRYPAAFIFITLDTETVDINIHPRKEEVQFLHPRIIEGLLEAAVKKRLEEHCTEKLGSPITMPSAPFKEQSSPAQPLMYATPEPKILKTPTEQAKEEQAFLTMLDKSFSSPSAGTPQHISLTTPVQTSLSSTPQLETEKALYRLIGQAHLTYIILETQEGLVLIDQHAAHERIMYERLKKNFMQVPQIKLLFPQIITLTSSDVNALVPYLTLFAHFGITLEQVSPTEVVIQETPVFLKNPPLDDLIKQAIGWISESKTLEPKALQKAIQEKLHAQVSCKAAVKAGDELSIPSMHEIIKELYTIENKLTCPHGRPTLWNIPSYEIEKKFKRDYK